MTIPATHTCHLRLDRRPNPKEIPNLACKHELGMTFTGLGTADTDREQQHQLGTADTDREQPHQLGTADTDREQLHQLINPVISGLIGDLT